MFENIFFDLNHKITFPIVFYFFIYTQLQLIISTWIQNFHDLLVKHDFPKIIFSKDASKDIINGDELVEFYTLHSSLWWNIWLYSILSSPILFVQCPLNIWLSNSFFASGQNWSFKESLGVPWRSQYPDFP